MRRSSAPSPRSPLRGRARLSACYSSWWFDGSAAMRQQVLQSRPPASTDWDPCTVPQDHLISTQGGFQLAYAIDLHDGRPVDAREPARIEAGLQRGERFAQ